MNPKKISNSDTNSCLSLLQIDAYLNNELPPEAAHAVERHLETCALCYEAVEGYAAVHNKGTHAAPHLHEIRAAVAAQSPDRRPISWVWSAAAVTVLAVGSWFGYQHFTANERTFASYYKAAEGDATMLRGEQNSALSVAINQYDAKDYKESLVALKAVIATTPNDPQALFYAGSAALALNDLAEAKTYLEQVHLAPQSKYSDEAVWLLALLHVRASELHRAREFLSELASRDGIRKKEASQLLKELQ